MKRLVRVAIGVPSAVIARIGHTPLPSRRIPGRPIFAPEGGAFGINTYRGDGADDECHAVGCPMAGHVSKSDRS